MQTVVLAMKLVSPLQTQFSNNKKNILLGQMQARHSFKAFNSGEKLSTVLTILFEDNHIAEWQYQTCLVADFTDELLQIWEWGWSCPWGSMHRAGMSDGGS